MSINTPKIAALRKAFISELPKHPSALEVIGLIDFPNPLVTCEADVIAVIRADLNDDYAKAPKGLRTAFDEFLADWDA